MSTFSFFVPEPLLGVDICPLLFFRFTPEREPEGLFIEKNISNFFQEQVRYVLKVEDAQAIVLPHNFRLTNEQIRTYIDVWVVEAKRMGIPLYIFSFGDFTDVLQFNSYAQVFKLSLYASQKSETEICAPTAIVDLGKEGVVLRLKSVNPTVSFCGKAEFNSTRERLASWGRRLWYEGLALFNPKHRARIRGVYWRQWAMQACLGTLLNTHFIVRSRFSGARRTIEVSPAQARNDFITSIVESDFVLAPKGDGNYSNRFLEALSAGRIPVLVDTDVVLPLEGMVDYSTVVVRVPMDRVKEIPRYIQNFYAPLSEGEWIGRQQQARAVFENYLRQDAFFAQYFTRALQNVPQIHD